MLSQFNWDFNCLLELSLAISGMRQLQLVARLSVSTPFDESWSCLGLDILQIFSLVESRSKHSKVVRRTTVAKTDVTVTVVTSWSKSHNANSKLKPKLLMLVDLPTKGLTGGVMRLGEFDPIYLILSLGGSYIKLTTPISSPKQVFIIYWPPPSKENVAYFL